MEKAVKTEKAIMTHTFLSWPCTHTGSRLLPPNAWCTFPFQRLRVSSSWAFPKLTSSSCCCFLHGAPNAHGPLLFYLQLTRALLTPNANPFQSSTGTAKQIDWNIISEYFLKISTNLWHHSHHISLFKISNFLISYPWTCKCESVSYSVVYDSLWPDGL